MALHNFLKQSTQVTITILMVDSSDHITGKTGLAAGLTITASKAGGASATITPTVAEIDNSAMKGVYSLVFTTTHTNTLGEFVINITATGADPATYWFQVSTYLPGEIVTSVSGAVGSVTGAVGSVTGNVGGNVTGSVGSVVGAVGSVTGAVGSVTGAVGSVTAAVAVTSNVKKNQALAKFQFLMTDSTNHNPATGLTVTCTRSIDGGAYAAGTLASVTEVANGTYTVNFGAGDLNGNVITLQATAASADTTFERIVTQP